jgi:hypothetical protein
MNPQVLCVFILIIIGLRGLFFPNAFIKKELLTPQQIERNKYILKYCDIGLLILGVILLVRE